MRIDAFNKVSQVYKTNGVKNTAKVQGSSFSDKLEISETGKSYQVAKQVVAKAPDVRMDRINDIKQRMEAGTYRVTVEELASHMVEKYFE